MKNKNENKCFYVLLYKLCDNKWSAAGVVAFQ